MNRVKNKKISGQAMILTTILLGGIMISASVIAGLLVFYQLRFSVSAVKSQIAVFAADAGMEEALRCYYFSAGFPSVNSDCYEISGSFANGGEYRVKMECQKAAPAGFEKTECDSDDVVGVKIKSRGISPQTERSMEMFISTQKNI